MAIGTREPEYAVFAAEAETAVAAVKDPELRRVAFDRILATLLERKSDGSGVVQNPPKVRVSSAAVKSISKGPAAKSRIGPTGYVEELIDEGFFKEQRTIAEVKTELANRGRHIALTSLSGPLQSLTQKRKLRRQKGATNKKGTKTTYAYSNW